MTNRSPFRYFKTSPEITRLAVTMYIRFPLSLRNFGDLLHERRMEPIPLTVVTNCLPVALVLVRVSQIKVILFGGRLRPEKASMVGPMAEEAVAGLWFSQLFLGAGAVDEDVWITSTDEQEARVNSRMIRRAAEVLLLADASKFGQRLTYGVCRLGAPMWVVSDMALDGAWDQRLEALGVALTRVVATGTEALA